MGIKTMFAAFAGILFGTSLVWGQCTTFTTSTIRNCNGIDYELWSQDNAGTITMQITGSSTAANGGTFEVKWNGTKNMLARGGKKWGHRAPPPPSPSATSPWNSRLPGTPSTT